MSTNIVPLVAAMNRPAPIGRVEPRLESEAPLFDEIHGVLKKYGVERKYGLALLHRHFDLAEDEVLLEFTDVTNRTLTAKPALRSEVAGNAIETVWSLDSGNVVTDCIVFCYKPNGQHIGYHECQ
jgi:hypothetical protein